MVREWIYNGLTVENFSVQLNELDQDKLSPLLKHKYSALADTVAELGPAEQIKNTFSEFQKYLYQGA